MKEIRKCDGQRKQLKRRERKRERSQEKFKQETQIKNEKKKEDSKTAKDVGSIICTQIHQRNMIRGSMCKSITSKSKHWIEEEFLIYRPRHNKGQRTCAVTYFPSV